MYICVYNVDMHDYDLDMEWLMAGWQKVSLLAGKWTSQLAVMNWQDFCRAIRQMYSNVA